MSLKQVDSCSSLGPEGGWSPKQTGRPPASSKDRDRAQNQAELGKMAEPPGGKDLTSWPSQGPFSADLTSAFFSPESLLLQARLFQFPPLFLLKLYPQLGSSFPSKGVEYI